MRTENDCQDNNQDAIGMARLQNPKAWLLDNYGWLTILLLAAGFSIGELYRQIIALLALSGLYALIKRPNELLRDKQIQLLLFLFLCVWIPMLVSLVDAEYLKHSYPPTLRYLMYFLAGVTVISFPMNSHMAEKLLYGLVSVMLLMTLNGFLEIFLGVNIVGQPYDGVYDAGMYHPAPLVCLMLAILSPLFFEAIRRLSQKIGWAWILFLPVLALILLGGSRTSWMLLGASAAGYFLYRYNKQIRVRWTRLIFPAAVLITLGIVLVTNVEWVHQRAATALGIFSGNYEMASQATSLRVPLWDTAWHISLHHWFNGIGPRAYTHAYDNYAAAGNFWIGRNTGHPHLFLLEISAETGVIGLIGFVLFLSTLAKSIWRLRIHNQDAVPWGVVALVAAFPLGSALSFYANFSSALIWFSVIVFVRMSGIAPDSARHAPARIDRVGDDAPIN